jgi:collagen type III alpha
MATGLETPRYETEVDDNIAQVSQKIRLADLGRGALALACLLLGYALVAALLDLSMGGSDATGPLAVRLVAFAGLLFGLAVIGTRVLQRYLTSVNPYYAARRLEETIPGAKNSLINWLDLKDADLPPVIHQAVGLRAARDVAEADADLVTSPRDLWKLAAATGVLFIGLVILFAIVPRQFGSLLWRAYVPLDFRVINPGTTITILKPGIDAVVPASQRVEFLARIDGRVPVVNTPGAPALLYRYTTNDVPVRVPLEEDINGQWGARLSPDQLRTGLFWKITAGSAASPEAQLRVRAQPFITRFEATYTYRPYRKLAPETVTMPSEFMPQPRLLGHRGTQVLLKARANAPIKSGVLELDLRGEKKTIIAQLPASEPQTLVFPLDLDKSGTFRIFFESPDGERNLDRSPYAIDVMEDGVPLVELVKPGKDLTAPPNGTVLLAGIALDDFGVTALSLHMTLGHAGAPMPNAPVAAHPLGPQPYKPKTKLQFDNGTFPTSVQYVDVLALDQLRLADGKQLELRAGDEITYWLEATDSNDFGRPNIGKSKSFKITIQDGQQPSKQQQQERSEAQKQKDQHDQQQSEDLDKQNTDSQQGGKGQKDSNSGQGEGADPKGGSGAKDGAKHNNPKGNGDNGQGDGGANKQPTPEEQKANDLRNELAKIGDKLNKNKAEPKTSPNAPKSPNDGGNNQDNKDPSNAGEKSPPEKGNAANQGKENPSNANSGPKDDPAGKDKVDKKGPGETSKGAANNQKDPGKGNPNEGAGGGQDKKKSVEGKQNDDDANNKAKGKGEDVNGTEKKASNSGTPDTVGSGKTPDSGKTQSPSDKSKGEPTPGQAKGENKGEKSNGASKSAAKKGDDGKGEAQAKGNDGKPGEPEPAKDIPPNQSPKDASVAKDNGGKEAKNPPTKKEIEALKDLLKKGGPAADKLAKELAKRGQDLQDQGLKQDLEKTLKDAGRDDDLKELAGGNREVAPPPEKQGDGPMDGQAAAPKDGPPKNPGKDPSPVTGPGGGGLFEELKKITPEEAFAKRMGNLQLDNLDELKKRMNPDDLKKANVSPEEWQRFLDNAKQYQDLMRQIRQRDDARVLKGGASKIASQGPRQIQVNPNAKQGVTSGAQALPPPEWREPYQEFTRKTKTP